MERILENAEYRKDIHNHVLIVKDLEGVDTGSYEIRMILANSIEGLLPCTLQKADGQIYFYYEITCDNELDETFCEKKAGYEDIRNLFSSIADMLKRLRSYLLQPDCLVLEPRYLYRNRQQNGYCFCYLPGYRKSVRESIRELAEYFLPKIDHQDKAAVILGYGIYQCSLEETFTLEQMEKELYGREDRRTADMITGTEDFQEREQMQQRREALEKLFEEEGDAENWWTRLRSWWREKRGKKELLFPRWAEEQELGEDTVYLAAEAKKQAEGVKKLVCLSESSFPDILLDRELMFIGKEGKHIDVNIPSPGISRLHARITVEKGSVSAADLHSRNGTRINGILAVPDREYVLQEGDQVAFADILYECRF